MYQDIIYRCDIERYWKIENSSENELVVEKDSGQERKSDKEKKSKLITKMVNLSYGSYHKYFSFILKVLQKIKNIYLVKFGGSGIINGLYG